VIDAVIEYVRLLMTGGPHHPDSPRTELAGG